MKEYIEKEYSLVWDKEKQFIRSTLFEDFCFDAAVRFRRDVFALVEEVRASGVTKIRALHDITRLPLSYRLDDRTLAVLLDVMDVVDQVASIGPKPNAKELLLNFFNTVSFLWQGKKGVYFKKKEDAEEWLLGGKETIDEK